SDGEGDERQAEYPAAAFGIGALGGGRQCGQHDVLATGDVTAVQVGDCMRQRVGCDGPRIDEGRVELAHPGDDLVPLRHRDRAGALDGQMCGDLRFAATVQVVGDRVVDLDNAA